MTATRCAKIEPDRLLVHVVDPTPSEVVDYVAGHGASIVRVERFDVRSPHCNKIAGACSLAASKGASSGPVALTDTDMLIMEDPCVLGPLAGVVSGKRVDLANPPVYMLHEIFCQAGLESPGLTADEMPTLQSNLNGGLYVLHGSDLQRLGRAWAKWAVWLLDVAPHLMGDFAVHVDQIAMSLAIVDCGLDINLLDRTWNLPTHLGSEFPGLAGTPRIIHYHRHVDSSGLVELSGQPLVDFKVREANRAIADVLTEFSPDRTFSSWQAETVASNFEADVSGTVPIKAT